MNPDFTQAARILSQDTLTQIRKLPFTLQGWRIVERWAAQSPAELAQLEREQGTVGVVSRLLKQQQEETSVLDQVNPDTHIPVMELMEMAGVQSHL